MCEIAIEKILGNEQSNDREIPRNLYRTNANRAHPLMFYIQSTPTITPTSDGRVSRGTDGRGTTRKNQGTTPHRRLPPLSGLQPDFTPHPRTQIDPINYPLRG